MLKQKRFPSRLLLTFILIILSGLTLQAEPTVLKLRNGDTIRGSILPSSGDSLTVETAYGTLRILRNDVLNLSEIESVQAAGDSLRPSLPGLKIRHDARWKTIYTTMGVVNTLYGFGIPYVLGVSDAGIGNGMRLLLLGGSFYASYSVTKNMDLPEARFTCQLTGTALGMGSIIPLIGLIGASNWEKIDTNGKLSLLIAMTATPFGTRFGDNWYHKYQYSTGQALFVSQAMIWGAANAANLLYIQHPEDLGMSENRFRVYTLLTTGAMLASGLKAHSYVLQRRYDSGDISLLDFAGVLGWASSGLLCTTVDKMSTRAVAGTVMLGSNAYLYLLNRRIQQQHISDGDATIVALGTGASWLSWMGLNFLFHMDYGTDFARIMDVAFLNAGFFVTLNAVQNNAATQAVSAPSSLSLRLTPTTFYSPVSGMNAGLNLSLRF